jgi:hypothetical protein
MIPLHIAQADPNFEIWFGQDIPHDLAPGRYPTPNEIIETINKFSEYEITQSLIPYRELTIRVPSTGQFFTIESRYFSGDANMPLEIHGRGDRGELEKIISALPKACGAFIVCTDGEEPTLVTASRF